MGACSLVSHKSPVHRTRHAAAYPLGKNISQGLDLLQGGWTIEELSGGVRVGCGGVRRRGWTVPGSSSSATHCSTLASHPPPFRPYPAQPLIHLPAAPRPPYFPLRSHFWFGSSERLACFLYSQPPVPPATPLLHIYGRRRLPLRPGHFSEARA